MMVLFVSDAVILARSGLIFSVHSDGFTQAQLARRMKTTQSVIARLESGRIHPSTKTLERLAKATGTRLRINFEPRRTSRV